MALTRSTDLLVWIDCEMTGLDPEIDQILSISCYITTPTLTLLDPTGYHATILTPASILTSMSPWCIATHGSTGLTSRCLDPTLSISTSTAASQLLSYVKSYVPGPRTGLLAGNTVHMDRAFLRRVPWNDIDEYLHYRILDVSSIKEGVRRWCSEEVLKKCPVKKELHVAKDDILESIEEARFYMSLLSGVKADG